MCIIVDANLASAVFSRPPADAMRPVIKWLFKGDGKLVHGGKLTKELLKVSKAGSALVELRKNRRAIDIEAEDPSAFAAALAWCKGRCRSNDPHVVAIARLSGARTLVTNDKQAMQDFKDKVLVPTPPGKIYQRTKHAKRLLTHTPGCRGQ
jgi:hypothetical protein